MKRRRPPNYRRAKGSRRCANCGSMNKRTGLCARYSYPVEKPMTCDTWKPDRR